MSLRINNHPLVSCQNPSGPWSRSSRVQPSGTQAILASTVHCAPFWGATFLPRVLASGKCLLIISVAVPKLVLVVGCWGLFLKGNSPQPVKESSSSLFMSCHRINSPNMMSHANTLIRSYLMESKQRLSWRTYVFGEIQSKLEITCKMSQEKKKVRNENIYHYHRFMRAVKTQ